MNSSYEQYIHDDNLIQRATCAVEIDGEIKGTAWLAGCDGPYGILITAGHILGRENPLPEVDIKFDNEQKQKASLEQWLYRPEEGIDFAILKTDFPEIGRNPLPLKAKRKVNGRFRLYGYGISLEKEGLFV